MFKWWFAEGFSFTPLWLTIQAFPSHHLLFCLIVAFTGPEINPQGNLDLFTGCTNTRKIFLSQRFSTVSFNGSEKCTKPKNNSLFYHELQRWNCFGYFSWDISLFPCFHWNLPAVLKWDRWCHLPTAHQSGLSNRICSESESDDCRIVWLLSVKCNQNPSTQSWWSKLPEILTATFLMNNSQRCFFLWLILEYSFVHIQLFYYILKSL